jgi:cell division protein FtsL
LIACGNIPDRQATAKEQTRELELASEYARAEYNRLKLKMKTLSDQITITAVVAKQVELIWKHP